MHRLADYFGRAPEPEEGPYGDFYVISGAFGTVCVTYETAAYVERRLDERPAPAWITFRDRVGSRVHVRTSQIRCIAESTAAQRAADRRLERARQLEEKADRRPWEDDDDGRLAC